MLFTLLLVSTLILSFCFLYPKNYLFKSILFGLLFALLLGVLQIPLYTTVPAIFAVTLVAPITEEIAKVYFVSSTRFKDDGLYIALAIFVIWENIISMSSQFGIQFSDEIQITLYHLDFFMSDGILAFTFMRALTSAMHITTLFILVKFPKNKYAFLASIMVHSTYNFLVYSNFQV